MYRLRELERKDLQTINRWRNDSELIAQLGAVYRYINYEVDVDWFENYMHNRDRFVRCAITEESADEILGLVSLTEIDQLQQSAQLHIMIGAEHERGKGMGTFAVQMMLEHAFWNMNLHRVEISVLKSNLAAQRFYRKCGFVYEGCRRGARYKNGQFEDLLLYSVLREEYGR